MGMVLVVMTVMVSVPVGVIVSGRNRVSIGCVNVIVVVRVDGEGFGSFSAE